MTYPETSQATPLKTVGDSRFSPQLVCDCGGPDFRVVLRDDDGLDVICLVCGGQALVLGTWEEMPTAEEATA